MDWFNQVDTTYRTDLRELNELNFARFDAKMEQRLAEFRAYMDTRLAEQDARWERRLGDLKAELIKWAFVFVAGGTLTVIGMLLTLLRR